MSQWTESSTDGSIPIGGVIMWTGDPTSVPDGWTLCDGTNPDGNDSAVPDLTDRFVVGAGGDHGVGDTGGSQSEQIDTSTGDDGGHSHSVDEDTAGSHSHSGSTESDGGHDHGGSTGRHQLTQSEMPSHDHVHDDHKLVNGGNLDTDIGGGSSQNVETQSTTEAGGNESHDHSISNDGSHSHGMDLDSAGNHDHNVSVGSVGGHSHSVQATVNTEPPFYALAYIVRIA